MKDKYEFVEYSKICRFIDDVNKDKAREFRNNI